MGILIAIVIDDEFYPRKEAAVSLLESGFFAKVHEFENLDAALAYLQRTKGHVHFVFCDVLLRNANGTQAVTILQPYVDCVVLFTGSTSLETREQANNSVPHAVLFKPFDPDVLKRTVERLLNPADPLKRLQAPEFVWVKPLDSNGKIEELEIKVAFKDIAYFKKEKSYVHIFVPAREGYPVAVGRIKTTIDNLYNKYARLGILLYANRSVLVHTIHITDRNVDHVIVAHRIPASISALGKPYYKEYLHRNKLLG